MLYLLFKAAISGVIVAVVSETARRSPSLGALIVSLPLVSILGVIWLWRDTRDLDRIAVHLESTFWYVLPSLPMFLAIPVLIRKGLGFWPALGAGCVMTLALYGLMVAGLARFGVKL